MGTYHQYCPIARASEILAERWNPLIVRNLMFGADTFSAIARGVPTMSRSMLLKRLEELERAGVIESSPKADGRGHRYRLTEAGADLAGVIGGLAAWGERWLEVTTEHSDPGFALWAWCQLQMDRSTLPAGAADRLPDLPRRAADQSALLDLDRRRRCRTLLQRSRRAAGSGRRGWIAGVRRLAPRSALVGGRAAIRRHPIVRPGLVTPGVPDMERASVHLAPGDGSTASGGAIPMGHR